MKKDARLFILLLDQRERPYSPETAYTSTNYVKNLFINQIQDDLKVYCGYLEKSLNLNIWLFWNT